MSGARPVNHVLHGVVAQRPAVCVDETGHDKKRELRAGQRPSNNAFERKESKRKLVAYSQN